LSFGSTCVIILLKEINLLVQDYVKFFVFLCGLAVIPVGIKSTGDFILLLFLIGVVGWALYTKDTA
jgi:hypothetical protein